MMTLRLYIFLLLFAMSSVACSNDSVSKRSISQDINSMGVKLALQKIYNDKVKWSALRSQIATGSKDWLLIAVQFHSVLDAGASTEIKFSIGEALEHHPENVFSFATKEFGLEGICSGPDIDDVRFDSYKLSIQSINKREEMVSAVNNKSLYEVRNACLESLKKAKEDIARFYGVTN